VERQRIAAQQENAGAQLAVKASLEQRRMSADQEAQGFKAGMDTMRQMQALRQNKPKRDNK
jgi:hypothetical protein